MLGNGKDEFGKSVAAVVSTVKDHYGFIEKVEGSGRAGVIPRNCSEGNLLSVLYGGFGLTSRQSSEVEMTGWMPVVVFT